ncbi:hypothetical protein [Flyfo microvirus Tbat2_108]|nr:hypothetical protein [Flyfo microvirus Tbat2_108]
MASSKRERQRREERRERRHERSVQGVSPRRVDGPRTVKEATRQERKQEAANIRKAVAFRTVVPDYVGDVTRYIVDAPVPANHPKTTAFAPSVVIKKTPEKKQRPEKNSSFRTEPVEKPSHLAREEKLPNCKKRPDKLSPRRAGGGASKNFVPWCK